MVIRCDQCELLVINGVICHEQGCPNSGSVFEDGKWVCYYDCLICGCSVKADEHCDCVDEAHGGDLCDFCFRSGVEIVGILRGKTYCLECSFEGGLDLIFNGEEDDPSEGL
jgi:hypothetical protein